MNRNTNDVDHNNKNNESTSTNNYRTDDINWWQWPQRPTPNDLTSPNTGEIFLSPTNLEIDYYIPTIKVLQIKEKILFYYWEENILNYCLFEKDMKELNFKQTNDFLAVLKELGVLD